MICRESASLVGFNLETVATQDKDRHEKKLAPEVVTLDQVKTNGKSLNTVRVKVLVAPEKEHGAKMRNGREGLIYVALVCDEAGGRESTRVLHICVKVLRPVSLCEQDHQATISGWNSSASRLRAGLAGREGCVCCISGVGMTKRGLQGELLILDLVCSTGVEIQMEGEGTGKLRDVSIVYSNFSDVGLMPDWSWTCVRGLVLEAQNITENVVEIKLVNETGSMLALRAEDDYAQMDYPEGYEVVADMLQVSRKYGNVSSRAESRITVQPSQRVLPARVCAVKFF